MRSQVPSLELSRARLARALPSTAHGAIASMGSPYGAILQKIQDHAAAGRVACIPRVLREGGIHLREVRHALTHSREYHRQDHGRFLVEGTDLSGRTVLVVVTVGEDGLVVTSAGGAMP